jgi:hypothetical protein
MMKASVLKCIPSFIILSLGDVAQVDAFEEVPMRLMS